MRAGKLRHRVDIVKERDPTSVDASDDSVGAGDDVPLDLGETEIGNGLMDGGGGYDLEWELVAQSVPANVTPVTGKQRLFANELQATITHLVSMRFRPGVTDAMQLRFNGRAFAIRNVINVDERSRELQLMCEEGAAI